MADEEAYAKVTELIRAGRIGTLTTINENGQLVSRPMALQTAEFDGDMWFFTYDNSHKAEEVVRDNRVNVAFESGNAWVSVAGTAELVHDKAKAEELWSKDLNAWFPDGLETPELVLLKVHADTAEYWDSGNKLTTLFSMAKAAATGDQAKPGENETVDM